MTHEEQVAITALVTDMAWVKTSVEKNSLQNCQDHKDIMERLDVIGALGAANKNDIAVGKKSLSIQWWIIGALGLSLIGLAFDIIRSVHS
mgnify:FL=1